MFGANRPIEPLNPSLSGFLNLVGKHGQKPLLIEWSSILFLVIGNTRQLGWQRGAKAPSLLGIVLFLFK